jgi:hypothetical protein
MGHIMIDNQVIEALQRAIAVTERVYPVTDQVYPVTDDQEKIAVLRAAALPLAFNVIIEEVRYGSR